MLDPFCGVRNGPRRRGAAVESAVGGRATTSAFLRARPDRVSGRPTPGPDDPDVRHPGGSPRVRANRGRGAAARVRVVGGDSPSGLRAEHEAARRRRRGWSRDAGGADRTTLIHVSRSPRKRQVHGLLPSRLPTRHDAGAAAAATPVLHDVGPAAAEAEPRRRGRWPRRPAVAGGRPIRPSQSVVGAGSSTNAYPPLRDDGPVLRKTARCSTPCSSDGTHSCEAANLTGGVGSVAGGAVALLPTPRSAAERETGRAWRTPA